MKNSLELRKKMKKIWKNLSSKILNFIIDLQQYNPYDALMVKNYNKKSLFLSFQDFQDFSGTGAGIPGLLRGNWNDLGNLLIWVKKCPYDLGNKNGPWFWYPVK